jgi:hypothetical protein
MIDSFSVLTITTAPIIPELWIAVLALGLAALLMTSAFRFRKGMIWRTLAAAVFVLMLLNPSIIKENRAPIKDTALILVDRSNSQNLDERNEQIETALADIQSTLSNRDDLDLKIITVPNDKSETTLHRETLLFSALKDAMKDIPKANRAGAILISDGQIHDSPEDIKNHFAPDDYGPVHTLLTGHDDEIDRSIKIINAPSYGITGQSISVTFQVDDGDNRLSDTANITLTNQDGKTETLNVAVGEPKTVDLPINHRGQNIFKLSTPPVETTDEPEINISNNTATLLVNGIRDRLKVLLVSGKPHNGGRIWRNLLTSDPGVDLVHFTILRDPTTIDSTPQNELSLIAFPFRELFDVKLYDFDLIVMDQYKVNRILSPQYFHNIRRYVEKGGALLHATGPVFADEQHSISKTFLKEILPALPNGQVINSPYTPALTALGKNHPVTRDLGDPATWGTWDQQIAVTVKPDADILMHGADDTPLLSLVRIQNPIPNTGDEEGRVAQIASNQIWLWARDIDGGGPHRELLRRTVHWLMKEPDLDERAISLSADNDDITVRIRDVNSNTGNITVTRPDGSTDVVGLKKDQDWLTGTIAANQAGLYGVKNSDGGQKYIVMGSPDPPELHDLRSTPEHLEPLVKHTGGSILRLSQSSQTPDVQRVKPSARYYGTGLNGPWIGLRDNKAYTVTGTRYIPLMPPYLAVIFMLGALLLMWWREGR